MRQDTGGKSSIVENDRFRRRKPAFTDLKKEMMVKMREDITKLRMSEQENIDPFVRLNFVCYECGAFIKNIESSRRSPKNRNLYLKNAKIKLGKLITELGLYARESMVPIHSFGESISLGYYRDYRSDSLMELCARVNVASGTLILFELGEISEEEAGSDIKEAVINEILGYVDQICKWLKWDYDSIKNAGHEQTRPA